MERENEVEEENKENKILVTGASGCLGASLVLDLVSKGYNVRIFILENTWHPFLDNLDIEIVYGDVTKKEDVITAMQGCSHVYHVAGIVSYNIFDDKLNYSVNYIGTKNVLDVAKELSVKKVVVTGSTAGIGIPENKEKPLNENVPFDDEKYKKVMYMYSKYLCIRECQKASKEGVNVSVISPTTIIGQGDTAMHMGRVVKKINEGKLKLAPPGGNAMLSVDDVVEAHQLVMEKGRNGENYIFANEQLTYLEIFNIIAKVLGKDKITKTVPKFVLPPAKLALNFIEKSMLIFNKKTPLPPAALNFSFKYRYFDSSKARRELGWEAKYSFEEAVKKAVDFYRSENLL